MVVLKAGKLAYWLVENLVGALVVVSAEKLDYLMVAYLVY